MPRGETSKVKERKELLLNILIDLKNRGINSVTMSDLMHVLIDRGIYLSKEQVYYVLEKLVKEGKLDKVRRFKIVYYRLRS